MTLALGLVGATGRLGRVIAALAPEEDAAIVSAVARPGSRWLGRDLGDALGQSPCGLIVSEQRSAEVHVVIDVSSPDALTQTLVDCVYERIPLVLGTTGLSDAQHAEIDAAAHEIPIVQAYNLSLGVSLLLGLVEQAVRALGPGFDIEIVEAHHRRKKDAPSGTALALAEAAARGRGLALAGAAQHGRQGLVGERGASEIGIHAVRGGTVVGDHQVLLLGNSERLSLGHQAEDRSVFARGALRAAAWVREQAPGRYTMRQVLGL
jgi:4-hydroxy-tetrahydrodipicolinate reductase